jgi:sugar (pentulose or hexulose) kinase
MILGIDLGTTTITALALDTTTGNILCRCTLPNRAETTARDEKSHGLSEWDVRRIADDSLACLRSLVDQLGDRRPELAGLGITGQQHGVVLVDSSLAPLTPFINWQDRRGEHLMPQTSQTYARHAAELAGPDAPLRTGCRLASGYMATTVYWMRETGVLPQRGTACFLMDYFGAILTGLPPVTDATCAASSGIFNVITGDWDPDLMTAMGLPAFLLPRVRPSGERLGGLTPEMAAATGLPAGLPVFVGIGDNQASFLGSVADRHDAVLVNVGTGAQVATFVQSFRYHPLLETRPFPGGGYLLVSAGLSGGAAYGVLERFFRDVGAQLFNIQSASALYPQMNQLAATVPSGAEGLQCEPFFAGTRHRPELRGRLSNIDMANLTPAHLTRALLEGMARSLRAGYELIAGQANCSCRRLIGAGNGLRENPVLARIAADMFGMPLSVPLHREEAAFGAALMAAVGAGIAPDLTAAGRWIRYATTALLQPRETGA